MEVCMCPGCNGIRTEEIGVLGQLLWRRCKECGIEFSEKIAKKRK